MKDSDCVNFLQWALPQMHMWWPGFRKVRRQVCKRIDRRLHDLSFNNINKYREYLQSNVEEWVELSTLCRITISHFYRDIMVFSSLQKEYLPKQLKLLSEEGKTTLNIWCIGCSSGEEPYTLSIILQQILNEDFPGCTTKILATDIDDKLIQRAKKARYSYSSIKNLPISLREIAFIQKDEEYCLKPEYQQNVEFKIHDVRQKFPDNTFNVIMCRNLVFTYFDIRLQKSILIDLTRCLTQYGLLIIGVRERLPVGAKKFIALSEKLGIYRKSMDK